MILTRLVCDLCVTRSEHTDATEQDFAVTIGKQSVVVDLCNVCKKQVETALEDVLTIGRRPDNAPRRGRPPRITTEPETPTRHAGEPGTPGRAQGKWDAQYQGNGKYTCPDSACGRVFNGPSGIGRHVETKHPAIALARRGKVLA